MSKYFYCFDRKWNFVFYSKENVDGVDKEKISKDNLLVCYMKNQSRFYSVFYDHLSFFIFFTKLDPIFRTFNEIVHGAWKQKPHFDLDAKSKPMENETVEDAYQRNKRDCKWAMELIIRGLIKEIPNLNLETDVLILPSTQNDHKYSMHIVVDHWACLNHLEAKAIYEACIDQVPENEKEKFCAIVDHAVYSSLQQFRFLGSHKPGKTNNKYLSEEWEYEGKKINYKYDTNKIRDEDHKFSLQFSASVVSFTEECKILPRKIIDIRPDEGDTQNRVARLRPNPGVPLPDEMCIRVFELFSEYLGIDAEKSFSVRETDAECGVITLNRHEETSCPLCTKLNNTPTSHQHENPKLQIKKKNNGAISLEYTCRRAIKNKQVLFDIIGELYSIPEFIINDIEMGPYFNPIMTEPVKKINFRQNEKVNLGGFLSGFL